MGPWDVMSAHFIAKREPPPGLSSFTKIRLGWIREDQAILINPGETRTVTLSPLERQGKFLAVKIPLKSGRYYLVENRQPVGFDRVLPDSGILILKVDPAAVEGSGTVRIMDADPASPNFSHATYRSDRKGRSRFVDHENRIAVVPLGDKGDAREILVTTPDKL